jgi:DNA-binding beta-propeller fold protein YncE
VTTLAGQATAQGSADGTGSAATFTWPQGIAFDSANGNLYVVDTGNCTIRQVTPAGAVTTIAGQAGVKGDADGTGRGASFNWPEGIAIDATNTYLYVADTLNSTIRQVAIATGAVITLAGQGGITGSADGAGDSATFNNPMRLVLNASDLYVADTYNETIRLIK